MNFHDLEGIAARNPALAARFRFSKFTAVLVSGERSWTLTVNNGEVRVVDGASPHADFTLTAAVTDWESFVSQRPPVGFQTLYAMATVDRLKLSGPRMIEFVRHQMGFEMLLQRLRPASVQTPRTMVAAPEIEPIVGRYIRMGISGVQH